MIRTETQNFKLKRLVAGELYYLAGMENQEFRSWWERNKNELAFMGFLAKAIADDLWENVPYMDGSVSGKPADSKPATGGSNPSPSA